VAHEGLSEDGAGPHEAGEFGRQEAAHRTSSGKQGGKKIGPLEVNRLK